MSTPTDELKLLEKMIDNKQEQSQRKQSSSPIPIGQKGGDSDSENSINSKGQPVFVKQPKPKLTKAERRAIQEKQRADKRAALIAAGKLAADATTGPGSGAAQKQPQKQQPQKPPQSKPTPIPQSTTPTSLTPASSSPGAGRRVRSFSTNTPSGGVSTTPIDESSDTAPAAKKVNIPKTATPMHIQFDDEKKRARADRKKIVKMELAKKQVTLFSHLPQYEKSDGQSLSAKVMESNVTIHSAILQLGLKYADYSITGSNARCVAMLEAFKQVVKDYVTPESKSLHRDLELRIKPMIQFLIDCRPMSMSMGNAINYLKQKIVSTANMSEAEAKEYIIESIDEFIKLRIEAADEQISKMAVTKINDGDVILTYASSHVIELALIRAFEEGKKFRVIVVDSPPKNEGKTLLRKLATRGIDCTYVLLNAISYIIKEVSKVLLGAYALLANGNVISRIGTSVVAMMAHARSVPVIVCAETYKFCERVQLDSICFNELGDPSEIVHGDNDPAKNFKSIDKLKLLNLTYDLTPMMFIAMVISEVGMTPPTSVPVILREYRKEPSM